MTAHCSDKDWLLLSRYLVGVLSPHQAAALESRLTSEAGLREALEHLTRTRSLLTACPEKKVPRNFTIKAGQTARNKAPRLFPVLRLATVVSSLLFAAVVGMRLLPMNMVGESRQMADITTMSQEFPVAENAAPPVAPKASLPEDETATTTPDARTASGAGVLTGLSPSQDIPEEATIFEADNITKRETISWGKIAWSLGIISLILAFIAVYFYLLERV